MYNILSSLERIETRLSANEPQYRGAGDVVDLRNRPIDEAAATAAFVMYDNYQSSLIVSVFRFPKFSMLATKSGTIYLVKNESIYHTFEEMKATTKYNFSIVVPEKGDAYLVDKK